MTFLEGNQKILIKMLSLMETHYGGKICRFSVDLWPFVHWPKCLLERGLGSGILRTAEIFAIW